MTDALICDAVRTPRGRGRVNGSLHEVKPISLISDVIGALLERNPALRSDEIEDVVFGVVSPVGEQGSNLAKAAAIAAHRLWASPASDLAPDVECLSRYRAADIGLIANT